MKSRSLLLFLLWGGLCGSLFSEEEPLFSKVAKIYARTAVDLYDEGHLESALQIALRGLDFSQDLPDLWFVKAAVLFDRAGRGWEVRDALVKALSAPLAPVYVEPQRIETLYFNVLWMQKEYHLLARLLRDEVASRERVPSEWYRLLLMAMKRTDDPDLEAWFTRALHLYPSEEWFIIGSALLGVGSPSRMVFSEGGDIAHLESLVRLFFEEERVELLRPLVTRWRRNGEASSLLSAFELARQRPRDPLLWQGFLHEGGYRQRELLLSCTRGASLTEEERVSLRAFIEGSPWYFWDTNMDGMPEYSIQMERGSPVRLSYDENQDGAPELEVVYLNGNPSFLAVYPVRERFFSVEFAPYPYISRCSWNTDTGKYILSLSSLSQELPIRGIPHGGADWYLADWGGSRPSFSFSLDELWRHAVSFEEIRISDELPWRKFTLEGRKILKQELRLYGEEGWDVRIWYRGGVPFKGERDPDGDGIFEIEDLFDAEGNLVESTVSEENLGYRYEEAEYRWFMENGGPTPTLRTPSLLGDSFDFISMCEELYDHGK